MTLSGATLTRARRPADLGIFTDSTEVAESTSIARGLVIGISLSAALWGGIIAGIVAIIH